MDYNLLGIIVLAATGFAWGFFVWNRIRARRKVVTENHTTDLGLLTTRDRLDRFFVALGITGDANIRDGKVHPITPASELHPLAKKLRGATNRLLRLRDPGVFDPIAGTDLYYRTRQGLYGLADVNIGHLESAASIVERVAEDKKLSRSLYKGISDDEIVSMVRAGMQAFHKSEGDYALAEQARKGDLDGSACFECAKAAIEILMSVKGASA